MVDFKHTDVGPSLAQVEWEAASIHTVGTPRQIVSTVGGVPAWIDPVGAVTFLVAAVDAKPSTIARADFICDGVADDVQIQGAIDALPAVGGRVVLSEGTFSIAVAIAPNNNVALYGQGDATLLQLANSANTNVINKETITNLIIAQLQIDVNGTNQASAGRGIRLDTATGHIGIYDVTVINNRLGAINIAQEGVNSDLIIDRVYIDGKNAVSLSGTDGMLINAIRASISNCIIRGCQDTGLAISGNPVNVAGAIPTEVVVSNLIVADCSDGIAIANDVARTVLSNIAIRSSRSAGAASGFGLAVYQTALGNNPGSQLVIHGLVVTDTDASAVYFDDSPSDIVIDGFFISGRETTPGANQQGIHFESATTAKRILISNGIIQNNGAHGILMQGTDDVIISAVSIRNNNQNGAGGSGIRAIDSDNVVVQGCRLFDDQGPATQQNGILSTGTSASWVVTGNDFDGNVTAPVSLVNTNIVRNNQGYVTENSGTGSIASGTTSVTITHGLDVTPTLDDLSFVFGENPTNDPGNGWIDTITATQFDINCRNDPGASNLDVAWRAAVL